MKCLKCPKEAVIKYPNGDLCNDCFIEILVNRVKKDTKSNPFSKGDNVLVFGKLSMFFLKKVIENLPVTMTEEDNFTKDILKNDFTNYDKVVIPWTADDEAVSFYVDITSPNPKFENDNKFVKIFKSILEKELLEASKILNINFIPDKNNEEIEKISRKYPSSKFGLIKSAEEFKKALQ